MKSKQLRYFLKVADLGGFSRASVNLDVAQSAISRQVRNLELDLGVDLFYRDGRGVSLTPKGTVLHRRGQIILQQLDDLTEELRANDGSLSGSTTIGLPPTIGRTLTLHLANVFHNAHPRVKLRLVEGFSGNILEWLCSGKVDVGVLYSVPKQKSIFAKPVVNETLVLVGPPDARPALLGASIDMAEVARLPLILPSDHHGLRVSIEKMAHRNGYTLNVVLEVDALFSMIETVRRGIGYTILSRASVQRDIADKSVQVWPIISPELVRTLYVATANQRKEAVSVQRTAEIVTKEILKLRDSGLWLSYKRVHPEFWDGNPDSEH